MFLSEHIRTRRHFADTEHEQHRNCNVHDIELYLCVVSHAIICQQYICDNASPLGVCSGCLIDKYVD